ncbi:MAG: hypothetical protein HYZ92_06865 [Candidatus Omnitrophica bacterium]|nr:hypothetical protein [Candidatus Omnitrophota bacterium]
MRDERLAWAEAQLRECQRIALRYFGRRLRVERKADRSPVTIADRTIEERLRRAIERAFPGEVIVGEEFGAPAKPGASFWTIDPIDGTRAFSRGLPSWGMLLGRVEHGEPVLGACQFPALNTFLGVGPGTPAYERREGRLMRLSKAKPPPPCSEAVILHGGSAWWLPTPYARGFNRVIQSCFLERAYGDCYGYLWLFRGQADAMLDYGVKVWDMAPLAAVARATGRVLTDCAGRPSFTGPEAIMAHPAFVHRLVKILHASG